MALHPQAQARPGGPRPARWREGLLLAGGVLLLHAALLALWPSAPGAGAQGDTGRPLQVRQIVLPVATAAAPAPPLQPPVAVQGPTPHSRAPGAPPAGPAAAAPAERTLDAAPPPLQAPRQAAVHGHEPAPEPGGAAVPVYATHLPPSVSLRYSLRRSGQAGQAELQWFNEGTRYRLSLRNAALGAANLGSASQGAIDAHGLAPERHTDSRRGRDVRAVNFQRDSARVTFSGASGEVPLVAGAQDRLSWMLQLAGIAEANPDLRAPGSELAVFVVGTRGDAEVWLCTVVGPETLALPAGAVAAALHLRREPQRLYDTTVDIWLDPARHHLPVQARLLVRPTGQETVLMLESMGTP